MPERTPLDEALDLAARGMSVFPVPRPDGHHDGKRPVIAWREFQHRRAEERELRRWFGGGDTNLAVATGEVTGYVVVDLDDATAARWWVRHRPYTPLQVRTAKGWHTYYQQPASHIGNRVRLRTDEGSLAIDVRGDGGYVIGPGSIHASGVRYERAGDWSAPREDVPVFDPAWVARPVRLPVPVPQAATLLAGTDIERARRYLAAIPLPEIGQGSDVATFVAASRLVRGFDLAPADAEELLWEWCGNRLDWTREWVAEKVTHALRYGTEPVGGLL